MIGNCLIINKINKLEGFAFHQEGIKDVKLKNESTFGKVIVAEAETYQKGLSLLPS